MNELTFIIPTLNEAENIHQVIQEIRELPMRADILVADNDSDDNTAEIVRAMGIRCINVPFRGKGNAIRALIPLVSTPYTVMIDADLTYSLSTLEYALRYFANGTDVVMGWRRYRLPGAMKKTNIIGNTIITAIADIFYKQRIHDVCTGLWVFKTEKLKALNLTSPGFTLELELFTKCSLAGYQIKEIPIAYRPRNAGYAKFHPFWSSYENVKFLLQSRFGGK